MEQLYGLSEDDVGRLKRLLGAFEAGRLDKAAPPRKQELPGPIPVMLGNADEEIPAASGSTPGTGTVSRWHIDPTTEQYADAGTELNVEARNPTSEAIPAGSWVELFRDPRSGEYWALPYASAATPSIRAVMDADTGATPSGSITVNLAVSGTPTVGQLVLAAVWSSGYVGVPTTTPPAPTGTGWTTLATAIDGYDSYYLGYKRYDGTTSEGFALQHSLGQGQAVALILEAAATPVVYSFATGTGTAWAAGSIYNPADGAEVLALFVSEGGASFTDPTGWTAEAIANGGRYSASAFHVYHKTGQAEGDTGDATLTSLLSTKFGAWQVAVIPQDASPSWGAIRNTPVESGVGPPEASNGGPGSIYFDVTDPTDPQFYYRD